MVEDYLKNLAPKREVEMINQEELDEELYETLMGRLTML